MKVADLADEQALDLVLDQNEIVIIDFWAPWCAPCRGFKPIFAAAAKRHADVAFCRVNNDQAQQLVQGFEIKSIPTTVAIRDRVLVASQLGFMAKDVLEEFIQKVKSLSMDELRRDLAAEADQAPT